MPGAPKVTKRSKPLQAAPSHSGHLVTPPSSPTLLPSSTLEFAKLVIETVKLIQASQTTPDPTEDSPAAEPQAEGNVQPEDARARASKLEFKTVDEVWDDKAYKYKIVESTLTPEVNELDEYVFVIRIRIDKKTSEPTAYIDIKSEGLRDTLRTILRDIKWISLGEDKPAVERNLLYNYFPELEAYQTAASDSTVHDFEVPLDGSPQAPVTPPRLMHLDLLIQTIKDTYKSTTERLVALLADRKITYDLLWALFKPNTHVYTTCPGTGKPRCVKYDFGEEKKTNQGVKYFELDYRYLDFDGKVFGEVTERLGIEEFRGARRIDTLDAFPLEYHPTKEKMEKHLITCGQKFMSMMGSHHCHYRGNAFFQHKKELVRVPVNCRIMIDAGLFRKSNPNYPRLQTKKPASAALDGFVIDLWADSSTNQSDSHRVKSNGMEPSEMKEDDLLLCCPTLLGFSLGDKFWGEFAVADISGIEWSPLPFDCLTIPDEKKEVIMALAENRMGREASVRFDDFVAGKGRGLNLLLNGPPGVGKTLTAEAISERLERPLYSISAGELSLEAAELETQLTRIFQNASKWNALLLLDEADVFLERRSTLSLERNRLVAIFLRKLEYFDGILFLTTNRVTEFDEAVLNRIHLTLKYDDLDSDARRKVWVHFLKRACTDRGSANISDEELDCLAMVKVNGRQIKNTVAIAHALATKKSARLSYSYTCQALKANGHFIRVLNDLSFDDSLYDD